MTMIVNRIVPQANSCVGMMLALMAFALLTSVDTIFKLLATGHPIYLIFFMNGCFALIPIFVWARLTGGVVRRLTTCRLKDHVIRGGISVMSGYLAVYAYTRLPLTDFYAIVFAGPLLVTTLSAVWLREKIETRRWLAIVLGFFGVLIVTNPLHNGDGITSLSINNPMLMGRLAALGSVVCYAFSVIMIRHMRNGETNITFSFYGYLTSMFVSGLLWLGHLSNLPYVLSVQDISHLVLSGMLSGIASICLMTAYHRTPASLVAPFQYTQIIWGALAGYVLWQDLPDMNLVYGAIVVAVSGLFVIYSEMRFKEIKT